MSWTGNIVSKVGHFLSDRAFQKGGSPDKLEEFQHYTFGDTIRKTDEPNGDYRPDTSSMTSFLLTILSSSNARYPRYSQGPKVPEELSCGSSLVVNPESCEHYGTIKEQEPNSCTESLDEESQESENEFRSNELTWNHSQSSGCVPNLALQPHARLPPMSEDSLLLTEDFRAFIYLALPTIAKDRHWILLYSTARHGTSMRTLYQKSSVLSEPYLLVIGDLQGATFGGLATAPLKPTAQKRYLGTSDTFVFTNIHEELQLYKATGANRYYILCTNDAISFGGGGHFAIHLDDTLLTGSSGACDTFGNDCLASALDFSVSNVEVWGFSHVLREG